MRKKEEEGPALSHAEYEALPLAVRKKYFSDLERLHIANPQHDFLTRPARSRTPSLSLSRSLTGRRRLRKAESVQLEHDLTQQDAQFFLALPEKLRKHLFPREEQVLLVGKCDQPFLSHHHRHHSHAQRARQRFDDFQFGFPGDIESSRGRSPRRSRSLSPGGTFDSAVQQESNDVGELDLDDESLLFLDTMAPRSSHTSRPPSSFRRTLSLTAMAPRYSTSSAPTSAEPLPPLALTHGRSASTSLSGRRSSHTPIAPVFDPEATHYQDPEARKKLRMFLASPQKFDEAVEFGFPSAGGTEASVPHYQLPPIATDARNFSRDMQTFLRDDKMSFLEDNDRESNDSDGDSVTDADSPLTPSSVGMSFRCHTRHASPSHFSSLDSNGLPPVHPMQGRLNREMTLRMTLTRPDLRAEEDQLYGWQSQQGGKDPFALEDLHLSDDMTGSNGAFAVRPRSHGNLVTRLFKRSSKKGR